MGGRVVSVWDVAWALRKIAYCNLIMVLCERNGRVRKSRLLENALLKLGPAARDRLADALDELEAAGVIKVVDDAIHVDGEACREVMRW